MRQDIKVLSLSDRGLWEEAESAFGTPSQCWRFAHALAASSVEPKLAIVQSGESRLLLPFLDRTGDGYRDIATFPGLSGASIAPCSREPLTLWNRFASEAGWVSGYVQLCAETHPNVPAEANAVQRGHMFLLNPAQWDLKSSPSRIIQRKAAAAARAGAVVTHDRSLLAAALQALYPETLARFAAAPPISPSTIEAWTQDPDNLLVGVMRDGRVEAVHLIHLHKEFAELHLAGVSERGRPWSALLYAGVLEELKKRGVTRCNLGGAGNPGDGLYRFKTWLGARPVPLLSIRQVYDEQRFEELCSAAQGGPNSSWFPPYRSGANKRIA